MTPRLTDNTDGAPDLYTHVVVIRPDGEKVQGRVMGRTFDGPVTTGRVRSIIVEHPVTLGRVEVPWPCDWKRAR